MFQSSLEKTDGLSMLHNKHNPTRQTIAEQKKKKQTENKARHLNANRGSGRVGNAKKLHFHFIFHFFLLFFISQNKKKIVSVACVTGVFTICR